MGKTCLTQFYHNLLKIYNHFILWNKTRISHNFEFLNAIELYLFKTEKPFIHYLVSL